MQYSLNEEQETFRKSIRDLAQGVIAPRAEETDDKAEFPEDVRRQLSRYGWLGLIVPEQYGGSGASSLTACVAIEEVAKCCASSSLILVAHFLGSMPILIAGSHEQKSKYFPKLASGEQLAAFALAEPNIGFDESSMGASGVLESDHFRLNGIKSLVSNGGVADVYVVFAKTDPDSGDEGVSAFIVEKSFHGFAIGRNERKMGLRGNPTVDVVLKDCLVPRNNLLGREGDGSRIIAEARDRTRPFYGAQAVGVAQAALESATKYAKERIQFRQPLAAFPAIQFKLAEMATYTEAARQLVFKAAAEGDRDPKEARRLSPMAKSFASDAAVLATGHAMQIMGGYGYMKEYSTERMLRDAKVIQAYEGSTDSLRFATAQGVLG